MNVTAYDIAETYVGTRELSGEEDNPQILAWLRTDMQWPEHDEVPWCSGFANDICKRLRLPRSKSLRARSWLNVGRPIPLEQAKVGFDMVILKRGGGDQPGPDVIDAPGHVGFYAGHESPSAMGAVMSAGGTPADGKVHVLGGNQGNAVSVASFPVSRILGIRRLYSE